MLAGKALGGELVKFTVCGAYELEENSGEALGPSIGFIDPWRVVGIEEKLCEATPLTRCAGF